jgi:hypothetical protein
MTMKNGLVWALRLACAWWALVAAGTVCGQSTLRSQVAGTLDPPFPPENVVIESLSDSPMLDEGLSLVQPTGLLPLLIRDQQQFYSRQSLRPLVIGLTANAILANTRMDQEFADWYQRDVRASGTDDFARIAKVFGEQWYMAGAFASASVAGRYLDIDPRVQIWGDRSMRSLLVGVGPLWLLQRSIGSSRPNDAPPSSDWDFWNDNNGASGHTFVGAIPFLVAGQLAERPAARFAWVAASTLPGWSRINDNDHYLSQVILGWCLAYAATQSVRRTDFDFGIEIHLMMIDSAQGIGMSWDY